MLTPTPDFIGRLANLYKLGDVKFLSGGSGGDSRLQPRGRGFIL